MSSDQSSPPVADTSYIVPFGVDGGRQILRDLHPGGLRAPLSVRDELVGLAHVADRVRSAAARQVNPARRPPARFEEVAVEHVALRERFLDELHADSVTDGKATGARDPNSKKNLGEADCMCLVQGGELEMRCNDGGARRVAKLNGIRAVSTAEDLRNLVGLDYTANKLAQIARRMEPLNIGATVSGPGYFRVPGTSRER